MLFNLRDIKGNTKLTILQSRLFFIGLFLKLVSAVLFAGENLKHLTFPFVNFFVESGFADPYTQFTDANPPEPFPYPGVMLYIFTFFRFIFGGIEWMQPLIYRLPLLLADVVILVVLSRMILNRDRKILWVYWLSPVLFYINYIHGQLDALPIMFLIVSFYFLFKKRILLASVIIGLAIATKTNVLLAVPFYLIFIWRDNKSTGFKDVLTASGAMGVTFLVMNLPFLFNSNFLEMVFNNAEQGRLWEANLGFGEGLSFYLVPAVFILLLTRFALYKYVSKDMFMMFIGVAFSVLILFIPPKPGWYFWTIPFLAYFYIKENLRTTIPLMGLQVIYLVYFAVIPNSDYASVFLYNPSTSTLFGVLSQMGVDADKVVNLSFTLLQVALVINVYSIYQKGIIENVKIIIKNIPCLIGIGGDSGVGKSTLSASLEKLFSNDRMTILRGDDMHKWERGNAMWKKVTHLSPSANRLHEEIVQMKELKHGNKVMREHYDHSTGKFTEPLPVYPNNVILFEGLHPFYIAAKREIFDVKIFINPEETLRLHWKISRDMKKRNYSKEEVLKQLSFRQEDSKKYIQSQAQFADIEVIYFPIEPIKDIGSDEDVKTGLRVKFGTDVDIDHFQQEIKQLPELEFVHFFETDHQIFEIKGDIHGDDLLRISYDLIPDFEEILSHSEFEDGYKGFLQLFVFYYIVNRVTFKN